MADTSEGRSIEKTLQFAPFSSAIDAGFWSKLQRKKLEEYHLDETAKRLRGYYVNNDPDGLQCRLNIDYDALEAISHIQKICTTCEGELHNTNTIETFKSCDKKALLDSVGRKIWDSIVTKQAAENPALLTQFVLLTFAIITLFSTMNLPAQLTGTLLTRQEIFSGEYLVILSTFLYAFSCVWYGIEAYETAKKICDLKKYNFYYWFGFPAVCPEKNVCLTRPARTLGEVYSQEQLNSFQTSYDAFNEDSSSVVPYFLVKLSGNEVSLDHIRNWGRCFDRNSEEVILGFVDPCTLPNYPGWPLRNFLAFVGFHWGKTLKHVQVICYRDRRRSGLREITHSIVLDIEPPCFESDFPKCVGWEKNQRQKLGPRMVNLSSSMDPTKLSESAVDLNLKLMRWRLMPELDLDNISKTKCLLLGAGTLGCNVARLLMGWGIRTITFVDNSTISYSNPVRQSLFEFEDSKDGGKGKAETAAAALKRIFPGVNSSWHNISIPMPGHPIAKNEDEERLARETVEKLDQLISEHDAVFLLLDTRESRWLPTVIAASKKKIVINAAMGFDTYLVMRHGLKKSSSEACSVEPSSNSYSIPGHMLGCYFCNDVVAPGDSTKDRSLDQQCTVSRPGMSYLASCMAVELLVSTLQHPLGGDAIADTSAGESHLTSELTSSLGLVPHQIRGFLSRFHQVLPASFAFDKCTACSHVVVSKYENEGFPFLLNAFNIPKYLEDLTGLTKLMEDTKLFEVWEMSDEEDEDLTI